MQARAVGGIDRAFEHLGPIARDMHLHDGYTRGGSGRPDGRIELAEFFRGTHVGPDEAAALARRIGFLLAINLEPAAFRFAGLVDDIAVNIELPAVIEAAQPAFLVAAEGERGTAVDAVLTEDPKPPL